MNADTEARLLEREVTLNPNNRRATRRLATLYERTGWTFEGKTIPQWRVQLQLSNEDIEEALDMVVKMGPLAFSTSAELLNLVTNPDIDQELQATAMIGLAGIGHDGIPALIEVLEIPEFADEAAEILGNFGEAACHAVPSIMNHIRDRQELDPPCEAIIALGKVCHSSDAIVVTSFLIDFLEESKSQPELFLTTLEALGCMGEKARGVLPLLLQILGRTRREEARREILSALSLIRGEGALEAVGKALKSTSPNIREHAVSILPRFESEARGYAPVLRSFLADRHLFTRIASAVLLKSWNLYNKDADQVIDKFNRGSSPVERKTVLVQLDEAFPRVPEALMQIFVKALADRSEVVRLSARKILNSIPASSVLPVIEQHVSDKRVTFRRNLMKLLGDFKPSERTNKILEEAGSDKDETVRCLARDALSRS